MVSGLDALLHRPRPTAWQLFLQQPWGYLARLLYSRRRIIPAQPLKSPISIVCISDTHNSQPSLPHGDVLIHAGDLTQSGTVKEVEATLAWLRGQPHPVKIVVAGNHDTILDPARDEAQQRLKLDWGDIIYLEDTEKTITSPSGRQLRVYGSPLSAKHGNWAFQYPRADDIWDGKVPADVDILITHGPPYGHLDLQLGCRHLLKELLRVRPRLHVFGHVHEGAGAEWVQFDGLQAAYEQALEKGGMLNLITVFIWLLKQYLKPAVEAKCLLVNPSMVGGLRDDERRKPVVVCM